LERAVDRAAVRTWAPASPCAAAAALISLLWLLPGGAIPALAQSDPTGPAPQAVLDGAAGPDGPAASLASSRVRPLDAVARALVRDGAAASPTMARLLERIERSDLVVYVKTGFVEGPGRLDFACAKPGIRYLRITVNVPDVEPRLMASLAHELQHAVEVAAAPEVRDGASLAGYYRRHGQRIFGNEYCTREAQRTTQRVLWEIAAAEMTSSLSR
jgi:hypothetical protein